MDTIHNPSEDIIKGRIIKNKRISLRNFKSLLYIKALWHLQKMLQSFYMISFRGSYWESLTL